MSTTERNRRRLGGFTLIELIIFIVIVSVGLAGVMSVFNIAVRGSADPMIRKNMQSLAESLLEEVMMQPYTYCDPDDPKAPDATGTADCSDGVGESLVKAEAGETRGNSLTPYDNVNDYAEAGGGLALTPVKSIDGARNYPGYDATINVASSGLNGVAASLLITVTVTAGGDSLTLQGYRTRHSPFPIP